MTTAKQVTDELIQWHRDENAENTSYLDDVMSDLEDILESDTIDIPSGEVSLVENFGGEGQGDDYWIVIKVGEQLFKAEGFHSSWEGANWDGVELKEVEAREITVVKYFYK